jgi:hypothetical protein
LLRPNALNVKKLGNSFFIAFGAPFLLGSGWKGCFGFGVVPGFVPGFTGAVFVSPSPTSDFIALGAPFLSGSGLNG